MASTSSLASLPKKLSKYDVCLSFCGKDTRHGFISHLYDALCRKSIGTFIDDELQRGEEISQGLLNAIEESKFAVVVFSKGYAFSRWCLDELAKIAECIDTRGQKVIPVFYHVDPSDVRKQIGTLADAVVGHKAKFYSDMEKVQRWRDALTKAANLSGWATQDCRSESAIVDGIVHRIWIDLQKMRPSPLTGLVGIGPRIEQLQTLLSGGSSNNVFILGIWGMGGIGKTTIARAFFGQIKCLFERYCFLANVREESEKCKLEALREKLLSKIIEDRSTKFNVADTQEFSYLLRNIKVLLVLDDVDDMKQLEYLAGDRVCYGPGSIIIITSRDRQVLKNFVDGTFQVKELANPDALQLFCLHAFKDIVPIDDLKDLSTSVVGYAKGVPLALKVLGSSLFGKSQKEWESILKKLENAPNKEIQDVLRISYNSLDKQQKEIFLWIACLLNHWEKDCVVDLLNSCSFYTESELSILFDKSLLIISLFNEIEMHDLLREMGREFVREESKDSSERSWLWNQKDIYQVFRNNSGTKKIKGIQLETNQMKELQLSSDTFARMPSLKFLWIEERNSEHKVHLPEGISALPELRYLYWERYPLKSLPANFNTENLIELRLTDSNIVELFYGETQDLDKLRLIDLSFSPQLCQIHNLSQARNVRQLYLTNCPKLRSLADLSDLKSLKELRLPGCSNLETFPKVPLSLEYLDLSKTAIKEVPSSSLECLQNLVILDMSYCTQLQSLPENIDLKSLEKLDLSGCSSLKKFPEISKNLEVLDLDGTAITEVPTSVVCLSRLSLLTMRSCTELGILPSTIWKLQSLEALCLDGCSNLREFPQTIKEEQQAENLFLGHLKYLYLSDCNLVKLPTDLGRLHSLTRISLRGNSFKIISSSIKQLTELKILDISECKSLQSLSDLPPNLLGIIAYGCTSLETVGLTNLSFESKHCQYHFNFADCLKLDHKGSLDVVHSLMRNENRYKANFEGPPSVTIIHTGRRIPEWFKYKSLGNSISFNLPSNRLNDGLFGFALGFVYEPWGIAPHEKSEFYYEFRIGESYLGRTGLLFPSSIFSNYGSETVHLALRLEDALRTAIRENAHKFTQSDHLLVSIKFEGLQGEVKKMCGVNPVYAQEEGYSTLQLLPLGRPPEATSENKRCRDADELGQNGRSSEINEEPPSKRLKQTQDMSAAPVELVHDFVRTRQYVIRKKHNRQGRKNMRHAIAKTMGKGQRNLQGSFRSFFWLQGRFRNFFWLQGRFRSLSKHSEGKRKGQRCWMK